MTTLKDKVVVITGASRGIGREIALRFAADGAKIAILAKTTEPHPTLPGTIYTVADEVVAAGGQALPIACDVRDEQQITTAIAQVIAEFGQLDILINNASAIFLKPTLETPIKRFDLMFDVNVRATYAMAQACLPHLINAANPHILTVSPPLHMSPKWFKKHLAYTMSKYGMSMCTLGLAAEFAAEGIAVNSLWPRTTIATSAIAVNFPAAVLEASRQPAIVADAAHLIVTSSSRSTTGNFFIDEDILRQHGVVDFDRYAVHPGKRLFPDLYIE